MKLTFWRRNKEPSPAERARLKAERDLAATRAETPGYFARARSHLEIQEVNHIGLNAAKALQRENK